MIERIVSGGQTGADRAALDVARHKNIPAGGWCPRGRKAEDGVISADYNLCETPSRDYSKRTRWNVRDSDGTLIVTRGNVVGGTALTAKLAERMHKPCLIVNLQDSPDVRAVAEWLHANQIRTLNVAGPRESTQPGIYAGSAEFLETLLDHLQGQKNFGTPRPG